MLRSQYDDPFFRRVNSLKPQFVTARSISNNASSILFAGRIFFDNEGGSEILSWNNLSDDYLVDANLKEQAGLPVNLFHDATNYEARPSTA